jgi:hypothetical protein
MFMTISLMQMMGIALASSVLTLAAAVAFYGVYVAPRLDARLVAIQAEFERHVKRGVLAAGEELLPKFREQVALGFADVLKSSHAAGIAEGTAKIVTGSTDLLMDGLTNLFGLKKK